MCSLGLSEISCVVFLNRMWLRRANRSGIPYLVSGYIYHNFFVTRSPICEQTSQPNRNIQLKKSYDFVVVGSGIAGKNAINELLLKTPQSNLNSILVIEKKINALVPNDKRINLTSKAIDTIQPSQRKVVLDDGEIIGYKKLLIACGRQYGFSNSEFIDKRCASKVINLNAENSIFTLTKTVKDGGHVTLIGGSWVSIAFASYLAHEATLSGYTSSVTLLIPGAGPLHDILPRPYSVAIMNRLKRIGVEVYPYMQLRYIGVKESLTDMALPTPDPTTETSSDQESSTNHKSKFTDWDNVIGVHCVQSYDLLKTYMFATDYIVPICESVEDLSEAVATEKRSGATFASDSSNSFLYKAGFEIDPFGCLVVNPSLSVVDDVYAAGDIANISCANGRGYGVGLLSATATGSIAAQNMMSSLSPQSSSPSILSSDIMNTYHATALLMGANIRFYGDCSTSFDTFSYWWNNKKNSSKQTVSDPNIIEEKSNETSDMKKSFMIPMGKLSTRQVTLSSDHISLNLSLYSPADVSSTSSTSVHQSETDILGTGIIFYVDSKRTIRGVAVCGTKGNPYFLHHYVNMKPAYVKASTFIGHSIDLPTLPSKRISSQPQNKTIDMNQQVKYLESLATEIFDEIQLNENGFHHNTGNSSSITSSQSGKKIIKFNELEDKPKCQYLLSVKRSSSAKDSNEVMAGVPWRWSVQKSNRNEKLFH
jgi:hypothetical protein